MDRPLKIIYQYKNNNNSKQYYLYIFVGNITSDIMSILKKIKDLDLFDTLKTLSEKDIRKLIYFYGKHWYRNFFISHHINHVFKRLQKYKYAQLRKQIMKKSGIDISQRGGAEDIKDLFGESTEEIEDNDDDDDNDGEEKIIIEPYEDEEIKETKRDINVFDKAVKKHKEIKDILPIKFNRSKDNSYEDNILELLYEKEYITSLYILPDDTIDTLKQKLCLMIKTSLKGPDIFIIPSRQYLWSEIPLYTDYFRSESIDKIPKKSYKIFYKMIGSRWMKKSAIWDEIDIVPNINIDHYYTNNDYTNNIISSKSISSNFIRVESEEDIVLEDYTSFITNNEIFMIDIYHELGTNFSIGPEQIDTLYDTYINIYFPKIKIDELEYIINLLNYKPQVEKSKIDVIYNRIKRDIIVEKQAIDIYQKILLEDKDKYRSILRENTILLSDAFWDSNLQNIDLYLIFDGFKTSRRIPFVQYFTKTTIPIFKLYTPFFMSLKESEQEMTRKWFQTMPHGVSFKVSLSEVFTEKTLNYGNKKLNMPYFPEERFMSILITEGGRVTCRIPWKDENNITLDHVKITIKEAIKLLEYINRQDNMRSKFKIPSISDFTFSFINSIQKFVLDLKSPINHDNLTTFASFFFPFFSIVRQEVMKSESEKRQPKNVGTYLVYKRISKYENSLKTTLENAIVKLLKDFQFHHQHTVSTIMREFNLSEEIAEAEIKRVKNKKTVYKMRATKGIRVLNQLPTFKRPGIKIDIKRRNSSVGNEYIFRILGTRSEKQLYRIIDVLSIIVYLYVEIYVKKRKEKIKLLLNDMANVALIRDQYEAVEEMLERKINIKQLEKLDKDRFGFLPEPGRNNYSRDCGKDKQPRGYTTKQLRELENTGYYYDNKLKTYVFKGESQKKGKKEDVLLSSVNLKNKKTGEDIHYTCHPDKNGENIFVGFLDRANHPRRLCMPCCYKSDHRDKKSKFRKKFLECTGNKIVESKLGIEDSNLDYILQDTNKLGPNRMGELPKQVDVLMNEMEGNQRNMKDHNILFTDRYYYKYGIVQDHNSFLRAVAFCLEESLDGIKDKIVKTLKRKDNNIYFNSLNNGKIKLKFNNIENFNKYVVNNNTINYKYLFDLLSIPGVIYEDGLNIFLFERQISRVLVVDEKYMKRRDNFIIVCQNIENTDQKYDPKRLSIFILKEGNYFFPIFLIKKRKEGKIILEKGFKFNKTVANVLDFYNVNCLSSFSNLEEFSLTSMPNAKQCNVILNKLNKKYRSKFQILDNYYKCIFLITESNYIIPVSPSGSLYNLPIADNIGKYKKSLKDTHRYLTDIFKVSKESLPILPVGVVYKEISSQNLEVTHIIIKSRLNIPVKTTWISKKDLNSLNLRQKEKISVDYKIDKEIFKGKTDLIVDERIKIVNNNSYFDEGYQLLRLNLSDYLLKDTKTQQIIIDKVNEYNIFKDKLYVKQTDIKKETNRFKQDIFHILSTILFNQKHFIEIIGKRPDLTKYMISNNRKRVYVTKKNDCSDDMHFKWSTSKNRCMMRITKKDLLNNIEMMIHELLFNVLKRKEILQIDELFVSSIVNRENITYHSNEIVIKSDNPNLENIMKEIFKKLTPMIKKSIREMEEIEYRTYMQWNISEPMFHRKPFYVQKIYREDNQLYRAFANGFYWIKNFQIDEEMRNIGYYNKIQTDLANYFKGNVLDYLANQIHDKQFIINVYPILKSIITDTTMQKKMSKLSSKDIKGINLAKTFIKKYIFKMSNIDNLFSNGFLELYVLHMLYNIPIYLYNKQYKLTMGFFNGKAHYGIFKYKERTSSIHLRIIYPNEYRSKVPTRIDAMYYSEQALDRVIITT
jgi:hypothetical protein